jgi:uncharacterized repeat protein (TIGR03847 family)
MEHSEHDFGPAIAVDAEAVGVPGRRRFRLMVRSATRTAAVWMEKQQLAGIGTWLEDMCKRLDAERPTSDRDSEPPPFGALFDLEMRAGQIALGYAEDSDAFVIQATDAERPSSRAPSFRCFLSRGQSRVLSRKIAQVVAAGRPICPLCSAPIDPEGHVCPRSNGHHAPALV